MNKRGWGEPLFVGEHNLKIDSKARRPEPQVNARILQGYSWEDHCRLISNCFGQNWTQGCQVPARSVRQGGQVYLIKQELKRWVNSCPTRCSVHPNVFTFGGRGASTFPKASENTPTTPNSELPRQLFKQCLFQHLRRDPFRVQAQLRVWTLSSREGRLRPDSPVSNRISAPLDEVRRRRGPRAPAPPPAERGCTAPARYLLAERRF